VQRALALTRLGLVGEAMVELDSAQSGDPLPGEEALTAWIIERRNPFEAHDRLHKYLLGRPASTLGRDRDTILQTAYPDHYWDLVQQATDGYGYDGRIFHALVREESSFNVHIVSWAGAKGLSQLMPATAKQVAGWLGISVNRTTIFDPLTNLRIGSRYLEYLRGLFDDNMVLAVPAYNAGEGNVGKWIKATDNPPTDEFVESIPIRETRHYVKRVLGTYQLYHSLYGDGPLYADWSARNHSAVP
jgi:soluble lytic murein transglycosylase